MKVLIVDDESLVRRALSRVLIMRGYTVLEADNGLTGVELWKAENPDMIFLDILMPGLSGPQVLQEVGRARSGKVILMSAYSGEYNTDTARLAGADLFIPKPFENIFSIVDEAERLCSE